MPNTQSDLDYIREQIDSLRAELLSFSKSINSNLITIAKQLSAFEVWQIAHEEKDDIRHETADRERGDLATQVKDREQRIKLLEDESQQRKGMLWLWKTAIGMIGATEAWHILATFFERKHP